MIAINSRKYTDKQTTGCFCLFDGDKLIITFNTLEPVWKDNKPFVSCIYEGTFIVKKVLSPTFGWCFEITNVQGRSNILFHWGCFIDNTEGCVLVGDSFKDINNDGLKDVRNSKKTFDKFMSVAPTTFKLIIKSDV